MITFKKHILTIIALTCCTSAIFADATFTVPASEFIDVAKQPPKPVYHQKATMMLIPRLHFVTCTVQNQSAWTNNCQMVGLQLAIDGTHTTAPVNTTCGSQNAVSSRVLTITNPTPQSEQAVISTMAEAEFSIAKPQDVSIKCVDKPI